MYHLSRRTFISGLVTAAASAALPRAHAASQRPDVLFIAIEDFSPHRLGCYGNTICKTPNIDRLASEGLRFDLAHCNAAPCCPSRTALLSGLRPGTTKVYGNGDDWSKVLKPGSTLSEYFMHQGYETLRCGKMYHAGNGNKVYDDTDRWTRVIEEREGIDGPRMASRKLEGPGADYAKRRAEAQKEGKALRGGSPFLYGATGREDIDEPDGMIAEQAVRLMAQERGPDAAPRFLALGFHAPHLPFAAPDKYFAMYKPEDMPLPVNNDTDAKGMPLEPKNLDEMQPHTLEQWRQAIAAQYATLSFVDAQIGRVLDALDDSGRADNTIVALWGDHGFMLGEHFKWRKGPLYDHSALVALLMKVPGVTKPGTVCKRPVESIDIFPTLIDCCGLPQPEGLEAISMKSLLADPQRPWKKGALTAEGPDNMSICTEHWRYSEYGGSRNAELFDRKNDPNELKNLAKDPAHAEVVAHLSKLIAGGWRACLPDGWQS